MSNHNRTLKATVILMIDKHVKFCLDHHIIDVFIYEETVWFSMVAMCTILRKVKYYLSV